MLDTRTVLTKLERICQQSRLATAETAEAMRYARALCTAYAVDDDGVMRNAPAPEPDPENERLNRALNEWINTAFIGAGKSPQYA